jgi:catechol 2,3-dioxygenase-like lactoylglutathione lyase family enzyme
MLGNAPAKAFVGVSDLKAAQAFYEGALGLSIVSQTDFSVVASAGGVEIWITKPPVVTPAAYTVLGFQVDDVPAMAVALRGKGVAFEVYPGFDQDADGVWTAPSGTKVAWFKDPDGNLLSISGEG